MVKKYAKDKTRSITLRVSAEQHEQIQSNALASGTSISDYVRNAVTEQPDIVEQFRDISNRIERLLDDKKE